MQGEEHMTKEQALEILILLSALESWGFTADKQIPDYIHENLHDAMDNLRKVVLGENT